MKKVAEVNLVFWIMKISATTLGETAGDMISMTFNIGYGLSSIILIVFFIATLLAQLSVKKYIPLLYWLVILATSTAGTTMSDFMDRTLGLGYATGALILGLMLISMLLFGIKVKVRFRLQILKTSGQKCSIGLPF